MAPPEPEGTTLEIRARPGSSRESITFDPWRACWTVSVRAPAVGGAANRAVLEVVARALALPPSQVRWVSAGRSRSKRLRVVGLGSAEVERRLRERSSSPPASAPPQEAQGSEGSENR